MVNPGPMNLSLLLPVDQQAAAGGIESPMGCFVSPAFRDAFWPFFVFVRCSYAAMQ